LKESENPQISEIANTFSTIQNILSDNILIGESVSIREELARNGINATMGTQTEALVAGGYQYRTVVESWDGTSWTETTDINTGRGYSGGSGTQTLALITAGQKSPLAASANSEFWNGTSWTEVNDLSTARIYVGGSPTGTVTSALITGGHPPYYTNTEEWSVPEVNKTITVS
jgi:hypothetical protein